MEKNNGDQDEVLPPENFEEHTSLIQESQIAEMVSNFSQQRNELVSSIVKTKMEQQKYSISNMITK